MSAAQCLLCTKYKACTVIEDVPLFGETCKLYKPKVFPLGTFGGSRERRAVVKKDIISICGWKKGRLVFAEPCDKPGLYNIRPPDRLGPTTILVPGNEYLDFTNKTVMTAIALETK